MKRVVAACRDRADRVFKQMDAQVRIDPRVLRKVVNV